MRNLFVAFDDISQYDENALRIGKRIVDKLDAHKISAGQRGGYGFRGPDYHKMIVRANQLSTTNLSVPEIAYGLGFEHTQSFSKLFTQKTKQSRFGLRESFS